MPTYDYACNKCGETFEVYQTFDEAPLKRHRGGCGGRLDKVMAPVGVVLKGSGFYKNDSSDSARSKSKAASKGSTKTDATKKSEKSDSTKPDATKTSEKSDSSKTSKGSDSSSKSSSNKSSSKKTKTGS